MLSGRLLRHIRQHGRPSQVGTFAGEQFAGLVSRTGLGALAWIPDLFSRVGRPPCHQDAGPDPGAAPPHCDAGRIAHPVRSRQNKLRFYGHEGRRPGRLSSDSPPSRRAEAWATDPDCM